MDKLHIRRADRYPRVSEHMDDIIEMVQGLVDKGDATSSTTTSITALKNLTTTVN